MTATSVPKGAKRRCESQGQERHQGEPAKMNTELIPKHNNPIGVRGKVILQPQGKEFFT